MHALLWAFVFLAILTAASPALAVKVLKEGGGEDPEVKERIEDAKEQLPQGKPAGSSPSGTATIRGFVFYNDQRQDGLFDKRWDIDGNRGARCDPATKRPDCRSITRRIADLRAELRSQPEGPPLQAGSRPTDAGNPLGLQMQITAEQARLAQCRASCGANLLGGRHMVVDVIERDLGFLPGDRNCRVEQILSSAIVGADGSFTATVPTADACTTDILPGASIMLRVQLKYCRSSYCFSMNRERNDPYAVVHPRASPANPMTVAAGDDITLPALFFAAGPDIVLPDNHAIAANYYASVVDTILFLHQDSTIPFYGEEFGELQYLFPSTESGTATALSPTEVAISTYDSQPDDMNGSLDWIGGSMPAHEYGHILMQRAWDGSYGFTGVGISAGDDEMAASPQIAFKEGWAEFIARAVFEPTRGCSRSSYDKNRVALDCSAISRRLAELREARTAQIAIIASLASGKRPRAEEQLRNLDTQIAAEEQMLANCRDSAWWRETTTQSLCDWYDTTDDDDPDRAGPGDRFNDGGIYAMWYNLRRMYMDADKYGGRYRNPGFWFCDYVRYYLDVRRSAAAVGAAAHATSETLIRDLVYNNNIACSLPAPR